MPASEIDDIFASKGRSSAAAPAASSSSSQAPEKKKKKKDKDKSAKRKRDADPDVEEAAPSKPPKRKIPETVFDPLAAIGAPSAKEGRPRKTTATVVKAQKPKKDREEDGRFKDSRGTGPRRKTEEGFSIFKEDELGITDQGGDTPLCPFDCQCCF
ncbi:hypothetical protein VTO73DRAFT_1216 [Trametes versicolor]